MVLCYERRLVDKIRTDWFSLYEQSKIVQNFYGPGNKLEVVGGFDIDAEGAVGKFEVFCPSKLAYFDEVVLKKYKKINKFPAPPKESLDKDGHLKFLSSFTMYIGRD
jgi:hypothetical protein